MILKPTYTVRYEIFSDLVISHRFNQSSAQSRPFDGAYGTEAKIWSYSGYLKVLFSFAYRDVIC